MNGKLTSSFLDEAVGLLVQHFGIDRVRAAVTKSHAGPVEPSQTQGRRRWNKAGHPASPSIPSALEQLRAADAEKYRLLTEFYTQMKEGKVLPESQDIRQFAQIIGLKEIQGKSRKDLLPKLIRFLMDQPTERVQLHIISAHTVSEEQRQQGFSVLTDQLLRDR